mgnify:CR=1 FL=1
MMLFLVGMTALAGHRLSRLMTFQRLKIVSQTKNSILQMTNLTPVTGGLQ